MSRLIGHWFCRILMSMFAETSALSWNIAQKIAKYNQAQNLKEYKREHPDAPTCETPSAPINPIIKVITFTGPESVQNLPRDTKKLH